MRAEIRYKVAHIPSPWDDKRRKAGEWAWCVARETIYYVGEKETGTVDFSPVALFNLDSEAGLFMMFLSQDGKVSVPSEKLQ